MKSIVWNLASVIVSTLFIPFLIHTDVKAQTTVNICNRTAAVETAILAAISDTNDCTMVTDTQLTAITELDLSGQGIDSLQSGDFAGLSGLTTLNLSVNRLTTLPAGLFSGLTNLVGVDVSNNPDTDDSFTLTATLKMTEDGMAAVEIAQGVPFTNVTVNLEISGGTFSNGMTTMDGVEILKGATQSDAFAYTVTETAPTPENPIPQTTITITAITSDPENILDGTIIQASEWTGVGYGGFELATGDPLVITNGICSRTQQVQDEIVAVINDPDQSPTPPTPAVTCDTVTADQLMAITDLNLIGQSITALQSEDFAGLTSLRTLNLSVNLLRTLPAGLFSGLTSLRTLNLFINRLTTLPAGLFSGLGSLQGVDVSSNPGFDSPPMILTATVKMSSDGMAVVEVAPGVPFTNVTATVEITGGTFSNGMTTIDNVVITTGRTQSDAFAYTVTETDPTPDNPIPQTTIRITAITSDPENILNGVILQGSEWTGVGYGGFELAIGDPLVIGDGICNRTQQVQDEIVAVINDPDQSPTPPTPAVTCDTVTADQLMAITDLNLIGQSITALQSEDFVGLTSLRTLNLSVNLLRTLPAGLFSGLTSLRTLNLFINRLRTLPAGLFSGLTNLVGVVVSDNPGFGSPPMILTATVKMSSDGMAVVEVAPGVPFTNVTATVEITGGTFSNGMTTIDNVVITTGRTQSDAFAYTVTETDPTPDNPIPQTTIRITAITSDPENILNGVILQGSEWTGVGYGGFELATGDPLVIGDGFCSRTQQVQNAILAAITETNECTEVTVDQLTAITELDLFNQSITALQSGDFAGLTKLQTLLLNGNSLSTLDADIFDGLSALESVSLSENSLSMLDKDIFDGLTNLRELFLDGNSLSTLDADIFNDLTNLTVLSLTNNDLMELPAGIFSGLQTLQGVDVSGNPQDPLTLTVTPKMISDGMAVIEVVQGVPFRLTATLSITGGTFSGDNATTATILTGRAQSNPFAYTLTDLSAVIAISEISSPMSDEIDDDFEYDTDSNNFIGYSGFQLASGLALTIEETGGICTRTRQVRDAIVAAINATTPPTPVTCLTLTAAQLAAITELDLTNQSIASLKSGDFAGLDTLTTLDLTGNSLSTLPADIFESLTTLSALRLGNNALTELSSGIFSGLTNLETLFLANNELTELPKGIFSGLESLTGVTAAGNTTNPLPLNVTLQETTIGMAVVEIPQGVPFTSVTVTLSISGGTFGSGTTLSVTLDQGDTRSSAFEFTVTDDSSPMPSATISISRTASDPTEIANGFTNAMGYSGFTLVSGDDLVRQTGICSRTAAVQTVILGEIDRLTGNVEDICDDVTNADLTAITELVMFRRGITALQSGDFAGLTNLQELNLGFNSQLMELPAGIFAGLTNLTSLGLGNNSLSMLDADIFDGLEALRSLNLIGNALSELPADIFDGLEALRSLGLSGNSLSMLDADIFAGLPALSILILSNNALSELPADIFDGLTALTNLDLSGNELTALPRGIFSGLANLTAVNASGNPSTDPAPLTLTVAPKRISDGMAVIEVVEGVPFTNVAATVTISDGTFSGGMTMMTVMIETGETQSDAFPYTVTDLSTVITVSSPMSDPSAILDNYRLVGTTFTGYGGFALASGEPLILGIGLCLRTPQVQAAILNAINAGISGSDVTCEMVTNAQLLGITGSLNLSDTSASDDGAADVNNDGVPDDMDDITELQSGDFAGLSGVTTLNLADNRLMTLPARAFNGLSALTSLTLTNNSLMTLPARAFNGLSALTSLTLTNNSLMTLPAGVFSGLSALTSLTLTNNSLMTLPAGTFSGLGSLRTLNLSFNQITTLDGTIFSDVTTLTTLRLENNGLTELPAGIFSDLANLTSVNVSGNPNPGDTFTLTVTLKESDEGMAVIEVVQGIPFTSVTATVSIIGGAFSDSMTTMDVMISKGRIQSDPFPFTLTPDEIATVLTVSNLRSDPINILFVTEEQYGGFMLAAGEQLALRDGICNRTPQVQDAILDEIPSLTGPVAEDCRAVTNALLAEISGTLNLTGQDISSLQAGDFAGLTEVTILSLENNALENLPSGVFSSLTSLTTLYLNSNALTELDADIFANLNTLATLRLNNNTLETLPAGIFSDLENLRRLSLQNNSLEMLPSGILSSLTNLQLLRLNDNDLTTLDATVFNGLSRLSRLDLNNNFLTTLPDGLFSGLTSLIAVDVSGNPKTSPALLTLTATPMSTAPSNGGNPGMAVIEISQGVPFINVTATVEIIGGEFSPGVTTTNVTIPQGETRSAAFAYIPTPDEIATILTVTISSPMNSTIDDDYTSAGLIGYSGFELVGAPLIFGRGICDRTQQVQDTILATSSVTTALGTSIAGVEDCNRVTNALLATIIDLNVSDQSITDLQSRDFAGLTILGSLLLNNNSLTTLPADIFANLNALTRLELPNNSLGSGTLPANVFGGLSTLQTLNLNGNALETLDATLFNGLDALIDLDLSENALDTLDPTLFASLSALTDLDLSGNDLTGLPGGIFSGNDTFSGLANLEVLDLSSNNLPILPPEIFSSLENLQAVNVLHNPQSNDRLTLTATLEEIDDGMAVVVIPQGVPFTSVTATLSITGGTFTSGNTATLLNGQTQSPAFAFTMAQTADTTVITISGLTPVPSDIAIDFNASARTGYSGFTLAEGPQLTIQRTICSRTPRIRDAILDAINAMPSESGVTCETANDDQLAAIPSLDLSDPTPNDQTTDPADDITAFLPGDLDDLGGLTSLTLNDNQLTTLPAGILSQLTALESLTLNGNGLSGLLPAGIFSGLPLTTLRLADNALTELPVAIFSPLTSLTTLDLSNNALTALPTGLFNGLTALTTLDLEGNALTDLPAGIFRNLGSLEGVDVSGQVDSGGNAIALSSLTITLQENGIGMAVIELAQGVPFTSVTATLSIAGGNFVNGTNADNTETEVTIARGETRSSSFEFTVAQPTIAVPLPEATLTIAATASNPPNILTGFTDPTGYSGFTLASGLALTVQIGVCNRTPEVQTAIVDTINAMASESGVTCDAVTVARLEAINDTLSVSGQSITALLSGDFAGLSNLTTLILSENNALTTLPADIFTSLTSLTTLLLNDNGLTTLDVSIFGTLSALTTLDLNGNGLTTLDANLFANLSALIELYLNDNALTSLPPGIFSGLGNVDFNGLTNLTTLDLSSNQLMALPAGIFGGLEMLTGMNASGQRDTNGNLIPDPLPLTVTLQEIDEGMVVIEIAQGVPFTSVMATLSIAGGDFSGDPTATATLSKGETRSSALAFTIDQVAEMTVLTVSNLISDPQNILTGYGLDVDRVGYSGFGFAEVPQLDIRRNICTRTPQVQAAILDAINNADPASVSEVTCETATAEQLAAITELDLSDPMDDIASLQSGDFTGLSSLTNVNLSFNMLTDLPDDVFSGLSNLTTLSLINNTLTDLPDGIFEDLTSLVSLNLASNELTSVSAELFAGLTSLTSLELGGNQLSGLAANTFSSLSGLMRLNLASNALASLDEDAFAGLSGLETLDLSDNELMSLPEGIFSGLSMLRGVDLSGNPSADPADFTLTLTPKQTGGSMFVIEVIEGAPIDLTATVTIQGGTFENGSTASPVTLTRGMIESSPLMVTATSPDGNVIISVRVDTVASAYDSDTGMGYSGLGFASAELTLITGICGRTDQVRDAILVALGGSIACEDVTGAELEQVLNLDLNSDGISLLQAGDFSGLSALTSLDVSDNALTMLPDGVFSGLNALMSLDVSDNDLMSLPDGVFSRLSALTSLDVSGNALTELPDGVFSGLTMLTGVDVSGNPKSAPTDFTLTLVLRETGMDSFVVEVAEGAPTELTVNIMVEGGTASSMTATIETGTLESDPITVTRAEESTEVIVSLTEPGPDLSASAEYSGLVIVASEVPLPFTFGAEERLEGVGESIMPMVSRELISGMQNVVSERIGRLATNPVIGQPTAQVAGQSSLSDLLTFTAQTFDRVHNQDQNFALETLLQETSFALSLNGEEGETSRTGFESIAVWGSADYQNVSGGDTISWDGSIISFHIGSDMRVTDEVLGGVSISWSRGTFDYEDRTMGRSQEGEYELELLSFHPYGGWTPLPWLDLWVVGGYGTGEVTIKDEGITGSQLSDVQSYSGAFGASAERDLEENSVLPGITTVRVKGQTSIAMMEVEDNGEMISSLTTEAYQQRVSVEVSHTGGGSAERYFIPTLEIGVRNDAGDGETGNGLEIGGEVEYRATDLGLRIVLDGRWLAVHSGELEEWGVGGSVRFERGAGQGFWMSITPEWGEMGSRELWDAKIEEIERTSQEREMRLRGEVGYGLSLGKASLTPSVGVSLTNQGYRSYRIGSGVIAGEFSLTLEGERRLTRSSEEEESVMLEGSLRF